LLLSWVLVSKAGLGRWVLRLLAVGYPLALLALVLAFRLVGERWWVTTVALYLPRWPLVLPLAFLALALAVWGPRRLLFLQAAALGLWLFPLMGLTLSLPPAPRPTPGAFQLRLLSFNIDGGAFGVPDVLAVIRDAHPDVVLLQEVHPNVVAAVRAGLAGYTVEVAGQFVIASRYPVEGAFRPTRGASHCEGCDTKYARYELTTPAGRVQVYNLHPISPHAVFEELRGDGLRHELLTGRIFRSPAAAELDKNVAWRMAGLQALVDDIQRSPYPVIMAGDTNLPGSSWAFRQLLGRFQDGFSAVGSGFGYTFPAPKRPWMRIDRILTGPGVRFLGFQVLERRASDHLAIVGDLEIPRR
jgi:endonuclease/exonuclease/phosphatase (EEP) superfamily protein YafD